MELLEFTMTGTQHSAGYKAHKAEIEAFDVLSLIQDKGNQYDTCAIKVLWQGTQIGWVPKKLGAGKEILDKLLDWQEQEDLILVSCEVRVHEPDNPVDMQLIAVVSIEVLSE
jgi:hypothetical protein